MRHRRSGRKLGRNPNHQRALLRNLASSLFLTERDADLDDNAPKVKGRIVTTLHKAKEVRPLVEKCVTIARKSLAAEDNARQFATEAERDTDQWREWRQSDQWRQWNQAIAPAVAARRRVLKLIGDKQAMRILFEDIAPRFVDRPGGYTRILRLAYPRLGDAGAQAILEFVGVRDREVIRSEKPSFADESEEPAETATTETAAEESTEEEAASAAEKSAATEAEGAAAKAGESETEADDSTEKPSES